MKYRRLGKSGLQVSELSFGAWVTFAQQISEATAERLMTIAYDAGVNFFDNAEAYANGKAEIVMGKILKRRGWGRDTFLVSSKVFWGGDLPNQEGLSRKPVIEACHAALRRLRSRAATSPARNAATTMTSEICGRGSKTPTACWSTCRTP